MPIRINFNTDNDGKPIRESLQVVGFVRELSEEEKNLLFDGIYPASMRSTRRSMRVQCEILEDVD